MKTVRSIKDKHTCSGRTVASCKLCGDKIMGENFLRDFLGGNLSPWQKVQINGLMWLSKKGNQVMGFDLDVDSEVERLKSLLFLHFTRRAKKELHGGPHKSMVIEASTASDELELLKKFIEMDVTVEKEISKGYTRER